MTAEELAIGDWVFIESISEPYKVIGIYPKIGGDPEGGYGFVLSDGKQAFFVYDISVVPIPLTPEILEKNGWAPYVDDKDSFYDKDCVFIRQEDGWYGICIDKVRTISGAIHYVHELQHCLKLVGIEKEIML